MATNKKKPTKKKNNKLETYGMHETSEFDQWSQSDDERNANIEEMPKERTEMEVAMETLAKTLAKSLQLTAKEDKKKKKMKAMEDECDMTVYIEEFEYLMEKTEVEEDEWANYLRPLLNSKARSAIAVLDIEERDDYELLKETILDQEDAARTSAAHSWWNLKLEKGQSVQEFVATIRRAAAKVPGATAKEVRDAFSIEKLLQSFPKHVAAQVRTQQPATLREAGKRVAEYFQYRDQNPHYDYQYTKGSKGSKGSYGFQRREESKKSTSNVESDKQEEKNTETTSTQASGQKKGQKINPKTKEKLKCYRCGTYAVAVSLGG